MKALRNELLSSLPTKSKSKSNGNGLIDDKSPSQSSEPNENRHQEDEEEERDDKIVVYEEQKEFDVEDHDDHANEEDEELERLRLEAIKAKRAKQQSQLNQPGQLTNRIYLNPNHISQTNNGPRHFYNGKYQQYRTECDKLMSNDVYEPEPSLPNPQTFLPLSHNYSYSNNSAMANTNLNRNDLRHLLKARNHQRHQNQLVSTAYQVESQIELLTDADLDESENELIYSKPITEPIHVRKPIGHVDNEHWNMGTSFRLDKVNLKIEVNNDLHLESSLRSESHHQNKDNNHRSHRNSNPEQRKSDTDKYESRRDVQEEQKNEVDDYFDDSDEEVGEYKSKRLKSVVIIPVLKTTEPARNEQRSRRDSANKPHSSDDNRRRLSNH